MSNRKRPPFVTIISAWMMLGGLMSPLFLAISSDHDLAESLAARPEMGLWHSVALHFGSAGVALLGFTLMLGTGIIGFGLWRMRAWARLTVIGLACASCLSAIYEAVRIFLQQTRIDVVSMIALVIFAFPVYYFERRNIRLLFRKRHAQV